MYDEITAKPPSERLIRGMSVLQPGLQWAAFRMQVKRVTVVLAHYIDGTILGFDFMTKYRHETASRLDSVVICYGWLTWLD